MFEDDYWQVTTSGFSISYTCPIISEYELRKKQVGAPRNSQKILKYLRVLKFNRRWATKVMVPLPRRHTADSTFMKDTRLSIYPRRRRDATKAFVPTRSTSNQNRGESALLLYLKWVL